MHTGIARDLKNIKQNVKWDIDLNTEFRGNRIRGYSFVIDVLDETPRLALYQLRMNCSISTTLSIQPPKHLLIEALSNQGIHIEQEGLYHINTKLRRWIEENILV